MEKIGHPDWSKREQQIMNVIYKQSNATVSDVVKKIKNPPSYSSIRTIMNIMVDKGILVRKKQGKRYIYSAKVPRKKAIRSAVKQILNTYFDNSVESAVNALLQIHSKDLSNEDLERLKEIIDQAKEEGPE